MSYPEIALFLGCLGLAFGAGCTTYNPSLVGSGGAGGGGGSPSGAGGGGAKPCGAASECPGVDDECKKRACTGGVCGFDFTAKGTAIAAQKAHDCQQVVCDGQGNMEAAADPTDPPDDMLECTVDSCNMSVPMSTPKMAGTACFQGGGKVCNDKGDCVECVANADCASKVCDVAAFKCSPAQCGDTVLNGAETDVDCGGAMCPPCALGKKCAMNTDCVGQNCLGGTCQPSCTDGTLNNGETDVDCGGPSCGACSLGKKCGADADCASNHCAGGLCYLDHLVINEVDYDNVGTDGAEFVEVYNGTGAPVLLAGYLLDLIDGAGFTTYHSYDLSAAGTLAPGQYLVVGATTVTMGLPAGVLKLDLAAATNNIQNGPDGIALVDGTTGTLVDALSYEGSLTMVTATGVAGVVSLVEGTALAANVADSTTVQRSLCRLPSGGDTDNAATDWNISATPTPGAANVP